MPYKNQKANMSGVTGKQKTESAGDLSPLKFSLNREKTGQENVTAN